MLSLTEPLLAQAPQLSPVLSRLLSKQRLEVEDKKRIKLGQVRIGKYVITGRLGHGGMGAVLGARDEALGREVALKCLPPDAEEVVRARFEREAVALARLDHANIVRVHASETVDGVSFLALEKVNGKSLERQIRTHGTLEEGQAWRLIRHVTRAMEAAEEQQILHRDLKPGNILWVPKTNTYKVCDFGLVRFQGGGDGSRLTIEGTTMGTPFYMSPEQVRGEELDCRTDMYSLGMTIHEALTGVVPFEEGPLAGVLVRRLEQDVPSLAQTFPPASKELVELVDWLTQRRRKRRPESWADLAKRLNVEESSTASDESSVSVESRPSGSGPVEDSQDPDALEAVFAQQETHREPAIGQTLGNYRLEEVIGRGGMGVVYRATHVKTGDVYAIKALIVEGPDGDRRQRRFETEVEALRRLAHEHIVRVYTYGRVAPYEWYAMDFVEGRELEALLKEQALTRQERLQVFLQICKAIEHAHSRGVVHRDLKPSNVLIDASNQARVLDFGLAKVADQGKSAMTRTSSVLGTPYYMAPEQFLNPKGVDKKTDVWALGVMLFEMMVGQRPFTGETAGEVSYKIMHQNPPRASKLKPNLSKRFDTIVQRALERDPEHRYESVKALKKEVIAYRRGTGREETRLDRVRGWIWRWYREHKVGFLVGMVFGLILYLPVVLLLYWLLPGLDR